MKVKIIKKKKVTLTVEYVESLKNKIKNLENENAELKADIQQYRFFFIDLTKSALLATSNNSKIEPGELILSLSNLYNKTKTYYFDFLIF